MDYERIQIAERQLDRVLQFASRIENKTSVLLATDLGIVAVMLTNLEYRDLTAWFIVIPLVAGLWMVSQSIYHLYRAAYPDLKGGSSSLIYFSEIAKKTEQKFQKEFGALSSDDLHSDLLGQIWRNSEIMAAKFESVKKAFFWTLLSLLPWVAFLVISSVTHSRSILVN